MLSYSQLGGLLRKMNRLQSLRKFWNVWRKGEYLGDAVILKVAAFGGFQPSEATRKALASLPRRPPDFSGYNFSAFAPGTLGSEYAAFMHRNRLKVFRFSGQYQDLLEQHFFAVWYAAVHDLVHVLTGFETTWAGEGGVWGFVAGQKLSPAADRAMTGAKLFYPVFNVGGSRTIRRSVEAGYQMGLNAQSIASLDFHQEISKPVAEIRQRFAIVAFKESL